MKYCASGVRHSGGCDKSHHKECTHESSEKEPVIESGTDSDGEDSSEESSSCQNPKHAFYEWFYENIPLGPAGGDVYYGMRQKYKIMRGIDPFTSDSDSDSEEED